MLMTEFDMNKVLEVRRLDRYEDGIIEGKMEMAKLMLSKDTLLDFIMEVTKLS